MTAQHLIVFALVVGCSIYALWALMPAVARRFIAQRLAQWPLGTAWKVRFQQTASAASHCDCSGCDKVADRGLPAKSKVVQFHVRPKD
ncbi:MAG: hypothetical protein K9K35_03895 [Rhodoferax sp.]|nr:hypothetical protein [Rhodoferax sp.]